jgi:hypothetical protein
MPDLVWSYSMLDTFEQCPLKWYSKYILKQKEPEGPELVYGNFVHGSIEDYLRGAKELPTELDKNRALIDSIKRQFSDQSKSELKMGVSKELKPCEFFGHGVWGRGAADVALIHYNSDAAFIGDWKTGKKRDKEDQLMILSLMLFKHYGKLQTISAANIWLKDNTLGEVYTFTRDQEQARWVQLLKRLQPMYAAIGTEKAIETRPGFVCNFCPVKSCKFNKS